MCNVIAVFIIDYDIEKCSIGAVQLFLFFCFLLSNNLNCLLL